MSDMNAIDPAWAWSPFEPSEDLPWDRPAAAHLYRRAGFGVDRATLDLAVQRSPAAVVSELLADNQESSDFRETADILATATLAGGDPKQLSAAWVYRLLFTPNQLLEKATLFWHGHFATGAEKVQDASMMWDQNQLLREHALGNFGQLVHEISQDPAMLIYLDSAANRKAHPNENFARELMELFCLGEGNYSETDVLELARCFTGWEIKNKKFRKNRYQHDNATKTCLGQTGNFDGEQGVEVVLEQPAVGLFIARKLYRLFVADEPEPSDEFLQPLADTFLQNDLKIAPVIQTILASHHFYSSQSVGRKIKSPVELVIGTLRCLDGTSNAQSIAQGLMQIGQGLFYPPNVKGWDGGRAWINSSTLLGRSNLMAKILADETTKFDDKSLAEYMEERRVRTLPEATDYFANGLLPISLTDALKEQLQQTAESQSGDFDQKLRSLLHAMTSLPHCQLA
jgi:uncharacterized protein (DUF1800 family)